MQKLSKVSEERNIGGPLEELGKDDMIANDIYEKSSHFETLRNRFLSVPLSGPMEKYYVTSAYGYRKDPYTKRRAFHKGIDLGAPWGQKLKVQPLERSPLLADTGLMGNQYLWIMDSELRLGMLTFQKYLYKRDKTYLWERR